MKDMFKIFEIIKENKIKYQKRKNKEFSLFVLTNSLKFL